jgi:transmembrane sensor
MTFNDHEKEILSQWLEDPTFINWAKKRSPQDMAKWEQYFNLNPQYWELGKVGRELAIGIPFSEIPTNERKREEALNRLINRLEGPIKSDHPVSTMERFTGSRFRLAAATIALALLASGILYFQFFYNPQVILATDFGEQLEHVLPDGSQVTLNANSTLKYYTLTPRSVRLEGEAYFEIKKLVQTNEKFNVWTTDLAVTVLGTSFNVNTRNNRTQVYLEEGKVSLALEEKASEIIELEPGDVIAYSKKNKMLSEKKKNVSALENASWKEGSLIFKDTPLAKALSDIEDIYGIQFVYQQKDVAGEVISGGVPIKNLEVTLVTLSEVYGIKIEKKGNRYELNEAEN